MKTIINYLQIVAIHRGDHLQVQAVGAVPDQLQHLLVVVPLDVDAAQLHDEVALLDAAELIEEKRRKFIKFGPNNVHNITYK